jgi:hypothetical protein
MASERSPSAGEELLTRLARSPDVYVQKFDLVRDVALLIQFDASAYRAASFLDDRILQAKPKGGWVPLGRVVEAARATQSTRPLHFIFHAGHVGSTLVSRLLDESGSVLSLREPLTLRLLAEAHDVLDEPESLLSAETFTVLLDAFLRLWERGYGDTKSVVVKATSSAGRLAPALLTRRPEMRAVYMNLRAEPYLATLLAGQNSPLDLRGHGPERVRRLRSFGMMPPSALHQMSLGETAALSWLVETWSESEALKAGGARIIRVDFDRFLGNIAEETERIVRHLGVAHDDQFASRAAQSPVLSHYAKAPEHAYTPQLRAQILADARTRHRDEIGKGLAWLQRVADANSAAADVINRAES